MMKAEEYKALAEEFRSRARNEESPALRVELEDLARCYEAAALDVMEAVNDRNRAA